MKQLHANIGQYTGTAPQAIQLVGQGQFIGAPNWSHDILTAKSQGQPIDNLNPQPTGFEVGAVSIIKGGIHLRRDSRWSIAYSEELISSTISATLQSTDRHDGIVGQERWHFQRDS
jgi:hypothetical protein